MSVADYDRLGFMCGLEVHQQLDTKRKLFCRCPAGVRTERVDAEILRHMRPTLSELGEYDGTALMEFKTRKDIVYRLERGTVCTYEIDDTPPFPIDHEAVDLALEVARAMDLNLVNELHVMRKQYLDGSIPTGFQRTAMIGLGGVIPFSESELGSDRVLRIRQLSLEEDSCREISDLGHTITFRTDRLGMPLVETVTEPDLLTPIDVARGADLLARVARGTGKVRRGAGAARQDVNVSVAGGRRVEIKGVCTHRILPELVHIEAFRQLELLRIKAELENRGLTRAMLPDPPAGRPWLTSPLVADARAVLRKSEFVPIAEANGRAEMIAAVRLPLFRRLLAHKTQPGMTFARELTDRVRVIACLVGRPFMIHSDVLDYGIKSSRWSQLRSATAAEPDDALVVVWGPEDDVATAARELIIRAREALDGVPPETRQSHHDGTTGFERILPGPDRMYPDTDTPPLPIAAAWANAVEARLPVPPWERERRYRHDVGLDEATARRLAAAPWARLFDGLAPTRHAARIAHALEKRLPQYWRETGSRTVPDLDRLASVVRALEGGELAPDIFEAWILRALRNGRPPSAAPPRPADEAAVEAACARVVAERIHVRTSDPAAVLRWAMGRAMKELRGRIAPAALRARLVSRLSLEVQ
jgi:glutamyl-tRNA(Gln) amidotransferase subunit E